MKLGTIWLGLALAAPGLAWGESFYSPWSIARLETLRPADAFDEWVLERELKLAEAEPPRFTSSLTSSSIR
jgi:hypothetical protein